MGILSDIFHKIFPPGHPAVTGNAGDAAVAATAGGASAMAPGTGATGGTAAAAGGAAGAPAAASSMPPVDVDAVLKEKASHSAEKLNWQSSIVDLLKLLGLDSSLESRKQLAKELGYGGDTNDSATMNVWLHRQVMQKLAANGGQVPAGLQ